MRDEKGSVKNSVFNSIKAKKKTADNIASHR